MINIRSTILIHHHNLHRIISRIESNIEHIRIHPITGTTCIQKVVGRFHNVAIDLQLKLAIAIVTGTALRVTEADGIYATCGYGYIEFEIIGCTRHIVISRSRISVGGGGGCRGPEGSRSIFDLR